MGGKNKLFQKQGRNKPRYEKRKPQIFPILDELAYFFPVFLQFVIVSANIRTRYSKISALRANRDQIQRFWPFFVTGNREEISVFSNMGGEKIRVFGQNIYPWVLCNHDAAVLTLVLV